MTGNSVDSAHFRQAWQFYSRIYIAQIDAIDTSTGTCTVVFLDNLAIKRDSLEVPVLAFSMQGFNSSWFRAMPQLNDLVLVGFGPRGEARILGPATFIGQQQAFFNQKQNAPTTVPVGDLTELAQGEFDVRSSGGAYTYWDQYGTLLMSAGMTQMRLNKKRNEMRGESGLWALSTQGSYQKFGDVKRLLLGGYQETNLPTTGDVATKELNVRVQSQPVLGVSTVYCEEQFGAVINDLGVIYPATTPGGILRSRKKIWTPGSLSSNPVNVPAWSEEVDVLGNEAKTLGPTATIAEVLAPTVSRTTTLLNETLTASAAVNIVGGATVDVTSAGPVTVTTELPYGVKLGNALAIHPAVLGDAFMLQQNLISEQLLALSVALNVILPAVQATNPSLSIPGSPVEAAFQAANTSLGILTGLLTTYVSETAAPVSNPMLSKLVVLS